MKRRQLLKVVAAAAAVPVGIFGLRAIGPAYATQSWQGETMDSPASLTVWHPNARFARATLLRMVAEAQRLEDIFSLYRPQSELSRLNRDGRLDGASSDLITVLEAAAAITQRSGGAFDPTVQPLWLLYDRHFRDPAAAGAGPDGRAVEAARAQVGLHLVDIGRNGVRFVAPTALTLNGIAQGYITDRIADLLRNEGFEHAMVELGETRALGAGIDGQPFPVGLRSAVTPGRIDRQVALADQSLSVSGGYGFRFGGGAEDHIFDPATGHSPRGLLDVAVIAPRATDADVLSTAIYVAGEAAAPRLLAAVPGASALLTRADGSAVSL